MQVWKDYQEKNKERFLEELLQLLRIPSVSAKKQHKEDLVKCAEAGADVCTCPLDSILGLLKHPLTDIGLAKFLEDAKKSA